MGRRPRDLRKLHGTRRFLSGLALLGGATVTGCGCSGTPVGEQQAAAPLERDATEPKADDAAETTDEQPPIDPGPITKRSHREHPANHAWRFDGPNGEPRKISLDQAEARGYTIVDLSNGWVPYIFSDKTPGTDDASPNRYREKYVGLANDRINEFDEELRGHQHNYLELYGIPPTFSVILEEWQEMEQQVVPCLEEADYDPEVFEQFSGVLSYRKGKERRFLGPPRWLRAQLRKAMRKARLDPNEPADFEAAATHRRTRRLYEKWQQAQRRLDVIEHAQKRFRCERLYERNGGRGNFTPGEFDFETTHALAAFEKKHAVMGWGHFDKDNLAMLALTPEEAVHDRLLRTLEERVVAGAHILEDGSAAQWRPKFRWKDEQGQEHPLPTLDEQYTSTVVEALGMQTPEQARESLATLSDLEKNGFEQLLVAVKLPEKPAYYSDDMEFEAVIRRGDVWYDFPFDEEGNRISQPRRRYPHLTVYVHYLDQRIPLVHWRTTIGSWRRELKDGEVYFKYKNSDVGKRVWKDIYAGPTWIPPKSTPASDLLTRRWIDGGVKTVVSYGEIGPGFRSAYGLVAAFHIRQLFDKEGNVRAELDNQIRTHGSVDYMSILRRYSHGCHRLYNMNAVRLFSFILLHRDYERHGQERIGFGRNFEHEGEAYRITMDTRGYRYELEDPIPVTVTEGRIRGKRKKPYEEYKRRPGQLYEEDLEQLRTLDLPSFGL